MVMMMVMFRIVDNGCGNDNGYVRGGGCIVL